MAVAAFESPLMAGLYGDAEIAAHFSAEAEIAAMLRFEVALARSALNVEVAPGQSIVEAVAAHGIHIPTSCAQGACGTCRVGVIEGAIDHQDVHLTPSEKARGDCLMACVSRAAAGRLVLDL